MKDCLDFSFLCILGTGCSITTCFKRFVMEWNESANLFLFFCLFAWINVHIRKIGRVPCRAVPCRPQVPKSARSLLRVILHQFITVALGLFGGVELFVRTENS